MRTHSMWLGNQGQMFASSSLESKTQILRGDGEWPRRWRQRLGPISQLSSGTLIRTYSTGLGPFAKSWLPHRKGDYSSVWEREHTVTAKLSHLPGFSDMGFVQKVEDDLSSRVRLWG